MYAVVVRLRLGSRCRVNIRQLTCFFLFPFYFFFFSFFLLLFCIYLQHLVVVAMGTALYLKSGFFGHDMTTCTITEKERARVIGQLRAGMFQRTLIPYT